MKVSINWAQYVSNVDLKSIPKDELLHKIGSQLGAIEEVIEWGPRYDGIVVAKVVSCEQHPNADKLHVCRIDDGKAVHGIERGDDGLVQVVCGAPNVTAGMTVAWLPPGSTVPSTIDKDPFVLGARELRGVASNGMLASAAELGISDDHDGILEITQQDVGEELMKPGTPFKQLYGLDDLIVDCENKMFTHRPDCFGILGVARELAGINNLKFVSPSWYTNTPVFKDANDLPLAIGVETELTPRFMAVAMDNISVGPSPIYMQAGLTRVGIRPINNVVDITNWIMHLTGQPLHAYDYDKVAKLSGAVPTLQARLAKAGETVQLLSGKTIQFDESSANTIVIATDKQPIALAGVMGGADTEVDSNTKNIIIEVANFDMYNIRKTAMKYGVFTDAVTRFNKGQSALQNDRVIAEAMRMMHELAGATQGSKVLDHKAVSVVQMPTVSVPIDFINTRLGSSLTVDQAAVLLENVECVETVNLAQETRSYLTGVGNIDEKLERIGVKIVEKTAEGHYKLIIPEGLELEYEKIVAWELQPGFWNEYIGASNVILFKDLDTKVTRYEITDDTEHEIIEMCRSIANEYFTSLDAMLASNAWYKPLLPLKKSFQAETSDVNSVNVTPPFWRRDLELPEDLVEEVGRLYGFTNLPVGLPVRSIEPVDKSEHFELLKSIRTALSSAGANEVVTYSFVHGDLFKKVGQDSNLAFHVRNALSPDLQYYRMSLTPSLLEKVRPNNKAGHPEFTIFEAGRTHNKIHPIADGEVPEEFNMLSLVTVSTKKGISGTAYYRAKEYLEFLAKSLGISFLYEPINDNPDFPVSKPFELSRSAYVSVKHTKQIIGIVGEYKMSVVQALKLPVYSAGFEIGTKELLEVLKESQHKYVPTSKFPRSLQDITLEVPLKTSHSALAENIQKTLNISSEKHGYSTVLQNGDIFEPEDAGVKRISFSIQVAHPNRTLTTQEVNELLDEVSRHAGNEVSAKRI